MAHRKRQIRVGLLLFSFFHLFISFSTEVFATTHQSVVISEETDFQNLSPHVQYSCDTSYTASTPQKPDTKEIVLSQPKGSIINLGITKVPCWFKIRLRNISNSTINKVFSVSRHEDKSNLWMKHGNTWQFQKPEDTKNPKKLYKLSFPPNSEFELWTHISPQSRMEAHFQLQSLTKWWENQISNTILNSLYYGAALIIALFYTILYLVTRYKSYLHYVYTLYAIIIVQLVTDDLGSTYIWSNTYNTFIAFIGTILIVLALSLFTQTMLNLKVVAPRFNHLLNIYSNIVKVSLAFLLFKSPTLLVYVSVALIFSIVILLLTITIQQALKSNRVAYFLLPAWLVYMGSATFLGLAIAGYPIFDIYIEDYGLIYKLGSLIEISLLAFALADQISHSQTRTYEIQKASLLNAQNHEAELEQKVKHKTGELKQALLELSEANNTKDTFFSIIAHDLRGPMGSITELLKEVESGGIQLEGELLKILTKTSESTFLLLENLLDWAKAQQGQLEITQIPINIQQFVTETISFFEEIARKKQIQLDFDIENEIYVCTDYNSIATVFRNLVSNAIKFTPSGGTVLLKAYKEDQTAKIEFIDTGKGMSPEKLSRLFKIGETSISTPGTNKESGSGLGLILTKELVAANLGEIGVSSDLDQGTTFWLKLPLAWSENMVSPVNLEQFNIRVLVADNNMMNKKLYQLVMGKDGFTVDFAENGHEAVLMATTERYDLVLLNVILPVTSGIDAALSISKAIMDTPKIIFLTSFSANYIKETYGIEPFDGVLAKPLNKISLIKKLVDIGLITRQTLHKVGINKT